MEGKLIRQVGRMRLGCPRDEEGVEWGSWEGDETRCAEGETARILTQLTVVAGAAAVLSVCLR